jgi:hypothetical protein
MRLLLLGITVLLCQFSMAAGTGTGPTLPDYYGSEFYQGYQTGTLKNQALLDTLQKILAKNQTVLGYDGARKQMFGKLFLEQLSGAYAVKDVYCERTWTSQQLHIGPGLIPDGNTINCEHTWPQSRFTGRFPKEMQKSDLHHLFPTDNEMNSHRSSLHFGYVKNPTEKLKCPIAQLGQSDHGEIVFEAPDHHKGNVARAIFYFATRYQMKISAGEEADLRKWNDQDPVDAEEASQNDEIQKLQGNRNPFIDFPDLLQRIDHF